MNHLLFDNARMNVWFMLIIIITIQWVLFCSFIRYLVCTVVTQTTGTLLPFKTLCGWDYWLYSAHGCIGQGCLYLCNSRHYSVPLPSPDNSLIFLFHLHCYLASYPEVMPPTPGQHIAALRQV